MGEEVGEIIAAGNITETKCNRSSRDCRFEHRCSLCGSYSHILLNARKSVATIVTEKATTIVVIVMAVHKGVAIPVGINQKIEINKISLPTAEIIALTNNQINHFTILSKRMLFQKIRYAIECLNFHLAFTLFIQVLHEFSETKMKMPEYLCSKITTYQTYGHQ